MRRKPISIRYDQIDPPEDPFWPDFERCSERAYEIAEEANEEPSIDHVWQAMDELGLTEDDEPDIIGKIVYEGFAEEVLDDVKDCWDYGEAS